MYHRPDVPARERSCETAFLGEYQQYRRHVLGALGDRADEFLARCAALLFAQGLQPRLRALAPSSDPAAHDLWPRLTGESDLVVPNRLLCPASSGPTTLQHLADHHKFTAGPAAPDRIDLHILGRLFEQTIGDPQRKRRGVFYTPRPIVEYIIKNTLGRRLAELRAEHLVDASADLTTRLAALDRFEDSLAALTILDPACGAGSFLLEALHLLVRARHELADERARLTGAPNTPPDAAVLAQQLHGVDIDPASIALTRRTLALAAATDPDTFIKNIRPGNALDPTFVWPPSQYDCIVGNPPYIKLQTLRQADPSFAATLAANYESARTGNFDLYLPFIEKSLALLAPPGLMGFVAPNIWPRNAHGAGLRRQLLRTRRLDRWLDFNNFQVFPDATTYTALQFYRGHPVPEIQHISAPNGDLDNIQWDHAHALPYTDLPQGAPWIFLPPGESHLLRRLRAEHPTLADASAAIIVGLQTSADHIFHLERIDDHHYRPLADRHAAPVRLEPGLLRPLIRGPDARRYRSPGTTAFLLFPYDDTPGRPPRLLRPAEIQHHHPHTWRYLTAHESPLRAREHNTFNNDDTWYRLGRSQNLDKQRRRKLGVAQTVKNLRVFYDRSGAYCFSNVRVNAILMIDDDDETGWFLLGLLNGAVADFVFRRLAKPKSGGYHEANKQFIAPLPVPRADPVTKADIAARARALQSLHDTDADPATLAAAEQAMNEVLYDLHGLTPAERELVAGDPHRHHPS